MNWQGKNVLVTGGTGFIGSAICNRVLAAGASVTALDNNFRGSADRLHSSPKMKTLTADIREKEAVVDSCGGMDIVFHLAFINGTEHFYSRPGEIVDIAIRGLMNVYDGVAKHSVPTVFLASSSEVYQSPSVVPTPESVPLVVPDILNPRYSYGGGKIIWELVGTHMFPTRAKRTIIFRPHNVYGPNMGWEHVIPQLITKIYESHDKTSGTAKIQIQGDGSQTRAFIYIEDFVSALMKIYDAPSVAQPEIYHVGTSEELTIAQLIGAIGSHLGIKVKTESAALPAGGTLRRCPDVRKLAATGFSPSYSFEKGLAETIDWYWNALQRGVK